MSFACHLPMESKNTAQGSQSRNVAKLRVQQRPEVLMAAREGDLARLIHAADQQVPAGHGAFIIPIGDAIDMDVPMDLELNTILHVVAASGDGPNFLESAKVVYARASHLLVACNAKGDTPFHCAARAGMLAMVSQLIGLARDEGMVKEALRKQNSEGETALHEALRLADKVTVEAIVRMLMEADDELARVSPADGNSPLYLAVLLGHDDIAERLHRQDVELSYSGPDGQNALHAAVLRSTRMTNNLLEWNKELSKQGDKTKGSTPLHFAASCGFQERVVSLLNADKSLAYQSDEEGSFPIHVGVTGRQAGVVSAILSKCPDCAQLRDARGKTFLHIAAGADYSELLPSVSRLLRGPRFASIVNMQDNDGNTVLHLAVLSRTLQTFGFVLRDKDVLLNLSNRERKTALDLSQSMMPTGVRYALDPRRRIHSLLKLAGARYGPHTGNLDPAMDEEAEAKKIQDSTQTIAVVSALLVTISFAAAFTVPGGYRTDDDPSPKFPMSSNHTAGTPVLAATYSFQAFIVANNLALLSSTMATIKLVYAGVTAVDIRTRMGAFVLSIFLLNSSTRSLAAAFAFGMYAALAPVARAAAVFTWLCAAASFLDLYWLVWAMWTSQLVLLNRLGVGPCMLRFAASVVALLAVELWPYAVIAGFLAYSKIHGIHWVLE